MLLDLDQGSMTVWKNDVKLGVMAEGLSGPLCWAVSLYQQGERPHPVRTRTRVADRGGAGGGAGVGAVTPSV